MARTASKLLSMNAASAFWAKLTGAPRPHRSTMIRWATRGVRGQRLHAEPLGGRWYTSAEAVEDFHRHLTALPAIDIPASPGRVARLQEHIDALDRKIAPRATAHRKEAAR